MAALPYIPFYVADYLADTQNLTVAEHGAYLLLIFNYWQTGKPLTANDTDLAIIAHMTPAEWAVTKPRLIRFFRVSGSKWRHKKIDQLLEKVLDGKNAKKRAGIISAEKRGEITRARAQQMLDGCSTIRTKQNKTNHTPLPPAGGAEINFGKFEEKDWRDLLKQFTRTKFDRVWPKSHGPAPGEPGCAVPAHIQAEYGFIPELKVAT